MNLKQLVRISNTIGIVSIILLIYWVFSFILIQVFGLKVFKENLTETFYLSIVGILALMVGALIMNLMFNLTRIAQKHNKDEGPTQSSYKISWGLLIVFPVLLIILFGGDYFTARKKERILIGSANELIQANSGKSKHLSDYKFTKKWVIQTAEILEILSKTDENFPFISILVEDSISGESVFLGFTARDYVPKSDSILLKKKDFITTTTQEERDYLNTVFDGQTEDYRYSQNEGRYELFYPFIKENKKVVIYFSKYQRYGKFGIK